MTQNKLLDTAHARVIADGLEHEVAGEAPETVIPGLILLIRRLARRTGSPKQAMAEVEELLSGVDHA